MGLSPIQIVLICWFLGGFFVAAIAWYRRKRLSREANIQERSRVAHSDASFAADGAQRAAKEALERSLIAMELANENRREAQSISQSTFIGGDLPPIHENYDAGYSGGAGGMTGAVYETMSPGRSIGVNSEGILTL